MLCGWGLGPGSAAAPAAHISLCLVTHQPVVPTVAAGGLRWVLPTYSTIEAALSGARLNVGSGVYRKTELREEIGITGKEQSWVTPFTTPSTM